VNFTLASSSVDPLIAALVIGAGLVAGFANVVAGGGSLLAIPLLVFLGVPATTANGTARIAVLVQCLVATFSYHRAGAVEWRAVPLLAIPVISGAIAGALWASSMSDAGFELLLGWVTLGAGFLVVVDVGRFFGKRAGAAPSRLALALALVATGFFGGLVQGGVGYLALAALTIFGGRELVSANVMKVVLILAFTPAAIAVFGAAGQIDLVYAVLLAIGHAVGGYLGASATLARGARLIRPLLFVTLVGAGVRLAFF
jgi:uncharacterized protein